MGSIAGKIATVSMFCFLGSAPLGVSAVVMGGMSDGTRTSVQEDVTAAKLKVEKVLLSQGEKSHSKDIKELGINFTASHVGTTIQVSGTFKDGYCIVGTNPGSEISEKGITHSYSADGMVSSEENECTENLTDAQVVAGAVIDQDEIRDTDPVEAVAGAFMYTSGGSLAALLGSGIIGIAEHKIAKRRRAKDGSADDNSDNDASKQETMLEAIEPTVGPHEITISEKSLEEKWRGSAKRLETLKSEWAAYELDVLKVLEYPAVTNMNVPATFEFHKAMRKASHFLTEADSITVDDVKEFREAVLDVEHRFEVMIVEAKRLKWNDYTEKERVSLQMAQSLLAIAINSASSPHERQIAYKRLMKEVEGIIVLPEKAVMELESKISLAIESIVMREPAIV